ncbi:MAG: hypothetical protein J0I41_14200 [Filimonas sp.]|nr:hypothetical protein [Filimonas sp.]
MKLMKIASYFLMVFFSVSILACSKSKDDDQVNSYEKLVTPAVDSVIKAMGITVNKGVTPPNIEGTYVVSKSYVTKSNFNDALLHIVTGIDTTTYFNQNNSKLSIDCKSRFKYTYTSGKSQISTGNGYFISGEGNKFTVISSNYGELTDNITGKTAKYRTVGVVSGEIVKNDNGTIKGIQNYQSATIMQEVYQEPSLVIKPNQARMGQNGTGATSAFVPKID